MLLVVARSIFLLESSQRRGTCALYCCMQRLLPYVSRTDPLFYTENMRGVDTLIVKWSWEEPIQGSSMVVQGTDTRVVAGETDT